MSVSYASNVAFIHGFSKVANHWVDSHAAYRKSPTRRRCSGSPVVSIQTAHAERVRVSKVRQRRRRSERVMCSRFRSEMNHCQAIADFYVRHWQIVPDDYILYDTYDYDENYDLWMQLVSVSKMRDYKFMHEFHSLLVRIKRFMSECNPRVDLSLEEAVKEYDMDDVGVADLTRGMDSCVLFEFRSI